MKKPSADEIVKYLHDKFYFMEECPRMFGSVSELFLQYLLLMKIYSFSLGIDRQVLEEYHEYRKNVLKLRHKSFVECNNNSHEEILSILKDFRNSFFK